MSKKIEDMLRKGMQSMGQVVERAIGKAQATRKVVSEKPRRVASPRTLESVLSIQKVKDLLKIAAERLIPTQIPTLADRRVFEVGDGVGSFSPTLKDRGAKMVVAVEIGGSGFAIAADHVDRQYLVRSSVSRLPFRNGMFDYGVANLLTPYQGDFLHTLKELSRILAPGGTLIATDFHPFGAYARRGSLRIKPSEATMRGLADYYKAARLAGLQLVDIRESFLDETVRSLFETVEEKQIYRILRETPLILCMITRKLSVGREST